MQISEGFQTSEFLLEHGLIDQIVKRHDPRDRLLNLISHLSSNLDTWSDRILNESNLSAKKTGNSKSRTKRTIKPKIQSNPHMSPKLILERFI